MGLNFSIREIAIKSIKDFYTKHDLFDDDLNNYTNDVIANINDIISGKIKENYSEALLNNTTGLYYHYEKKNYELSEKYYKIAIEQGDIDSLCCLADLYDDQNKKELAEEYYLLGIKKNDKYCFGRLADLYYEQNKMDLAEKYYLLAMGKNQDALEDLIAFYESQNKVELANFLRRNSSKNLC
ncbi:MAG: hypothetical protein Edafosvirus11_5 [Edafosvirus sp.]|uniref:Tetratricopeptide repeat protein n=1 Tax=Edafosvirus sp. TaxID=2487765 RepID=A0A3G4ZTZ4_9VIRU|nr:MAG: hypothetical protein Edafosvirus11_5 [Edafosvirus sp.]